MVDPIYVLVAAGFGFVSYLAFPILASGLNPAVRHKLAHIFWGLTARSMGAMVIVRRTIGKHQLKKMEFDDSKAAAKVVLDDGVLGDSKPLHFNDPDDRSHRLKRKQLALLHENANGVIDIKLAEQGHWWTRHKDEGKKYTPEGALNPHFNLPETTRLSNLDDALALILGDTEPQDVKTMTDYTKHRFAKYADSIDAIDGLIGIIAAVTGFALPGIGRYVNVKIIGEESGGGPTTTVPVDHIQDVTLTLADTGLDFMTVIL